KGDHLAFEVAAELADIVIIGIEHGYAAWMQGFDDFVLGAGNFSQRVEEFQMHGRNRSDYGQIMMGQSAEGANLTRMIHAHLDDSDLMLRLQLQQLKRQADVIVQVTSALEDAEAHH